MPSGTPDGLNAKAGLKGGQVKCIIAQWYHSDLFAFILIACGVLIRLRQYIFNRSLWLDEALMAMRLSECSFAQLFRPVSWYGFDPIGFMGVLKCLIRIFGNCEYSLRLFPLVCSLVAFIFFYKIAKKYLSRGAVPLALCLFAFSDKLIYYSSEAKPYSSDVLMTLLITYTALADHPRRQGSKMLMIAGIGAIAVWFSYPSIFVTAGIVSVFFLDAALKKKWAAMIRYGVVGLTVVLGFLAYHVIYLRHLSENFIVRWAWVCQYVYMFPRTMAQWAWNIQKIYELSFKQWEWASCGMSDLAILICLVGAVVFFKTNRKILIAWILPLFFMFISAGVGQYPLSGRVTLYYVPIAFYLIAQGADTFRSKCKQAGYSFLGVFFLILLLSPLIFWGGSRLIKPHEREEIRPVLDAIKRHYQEGDVLYIYYGAQPAFNYYNKIKSGGKYDFGKEMRLVNGINRREIYPGEYWTDASRLRHEKRVWFLFSHVKEYAGCSEERFYLDYLDTIAKRQNVFTSGSVSVYLYDMS